MRRLLLILSLVAVHARADCTPAELFRSDDIQTTAADASYIYAATGVNSTIWRINRATGATRPLLAETTRVSGMMSDGTTLFYVTSSNALRAESIVGGQPRILVANDPRPFGTPVSDGMFIYWVVGSTPLQGDLVHNDGEIRRVQIAGGAEEVVASGLTLTWPTDLSVDSDFLYVLGASRIVRIPKSGGEAVQIATGPITSLADGPPDALWWVTSTRIGNINEAGIGSTSELAVWRFVKSDGTFEEWVHRPMLHPGTTATAAVSADGRIYTAWSGTIGGVDFVGDLAISVRDAATRQLSNEPAQIIAAGSDGIFVWSLGAVERLCDPPNRRRPSSQ